MFFKELLKIDPLTPYFQGVIIYFRGKRPRNLSKLKVIQQ